MSSSSVIELLQDLGLSDRHLTDMTALECVWQEPHGEVRWKPLMPGIGTTTASASAATSRIDTIVAELQADHALIREWLERLHAIPRTTCLTLAATFY